MKPTITNKKGYAEHASLESISVELAKAAQDLKHQAQEVDWLSTLLYQRVLQVAHGEWPKKKTS